MSKIPTTRDCGPDAAEHADDRGEAMRPAVRFEDLYDRTGSWVNRMPYTSAEYQRLEGNFPEW